MADTQPPLNYEASATTTHPHISSSLPSEVVTCLQNAQFLHLATCAPFTASPSTSQGPALPIPHVSLMNYTFLPSTPYHATPIIIMTTNPQSLKTRNLLSNPNVSLLVHDWVSHRPPTRTPNNNAGPRSGSPPPAATRSSLAALLLNLNTSAMSSISTTITGTAQFLDRGSEEEKWCKEAHLANNTFEGKRDDQQEDLLGMSGLQPVESRTNATTISAMRRESGGNDGAHNDGGSGAFIEGEDVRVVVVRVREGRIADWKGGVKDWSVVASGEGADGDEAHDQRGTTNGTLVNGI